MVSSAISTLAVTSTSVATSISLDSRSAANVISSHGVLDEGVLFIQKPFLIADLAAKVREALDNE